MLKDKCYGKAILERLVKNKDKGVGRKRAYILARGEGENSSTY